MRSAAVVSVPGVLQNDFLTKLKSQCSQSGLTIFRYACDTLSAVPTFIGAQLSHLKAPAIFKHTAQLFFYDIFLMALIHGASAWLTTSGKKETPLEQSLAAQLGVYFVAMASALLMLRQKTRFMMHTLILSLVYPKGFHESSLLTRPKVDASVCDGCTKTRHLKGEFRTLIVFFMQMLSLGLLQLIPYVGWLIAAFSRLMLMGQLAAEYRLANDEICDRHRSEYFHQYPLFFFTLGVMQWGFTNAPWLLHTALSYLVAPLPLIGALVSTPLMLMQMVLNFLEIPAVNSAFNTLVGFYFLGLVHHMRFPLSVKEASQHFYDPLMLVRAGVSHLMDLLIPGIKERFNKIAEEKRNKISWTGLHDLVVAVFACRYVNWVSKVILPSVVRDFKTFRQDPIMAQYWPMVFERLTHDLGKVLKLREHVLVFGSVMDFYKQYMVPVQQAAAVLGVALMVFSPVFAGLKIAAGIFRPMSLACSLLGAEQNAKSATDVASRHSASISEIVNLLSGFPKGLVLLVVSLLRDQKFVEDLTKFRGWMNEKLKVLEDEKVKAIGDCAFPDLIKGTAASNTATQTGTVPSAVVRPVSAARGDDEFVLVESEEEKRNRLHAEDVERAKEDELGTLDKGWGVVSKPRPSLGLFRGIKRDSSSDVEDIPSDPEEFEERYSSSHFAPLIAPPTQSILVFGRDRR